MAKKSDNENKTKKPKKTKKETTSISKFLKDKDGNEITLGDIAQAILEAEQESGDSDEKAFDYETLFKNTVKIGSTKLDDNLPIEERCKNLESLVGQLTKMMTTYQEAITYLMLEIDDLKEDNNVMFEGAVQAKVIYSATLATIVQTMKDKGIIDSNTYVDNLNENIMDIVKAYHDMGIDIHIGDFDDDDMKQQVEAKNAEKKKTKKNKVTTFNFKNKKDK
jgi:FtsZ-binding cell division protein ZapB